MSIRTVLVSAALLTLCGAVSSQPPQLPPLPVPARLDFSPPAPPGVPPPPAFVVPAAPPVPVKPTPPPEKSVEELLNELERVQAQKAELEKKEQELKATVLKKLEQQTERLQKLGVAPKDAKMPDRVGRIIIEGNDAKDEKKILEAVGMRPGQVLQYPVLEFARARLEKAGFKSVTVEVLPNELDSTFKDIRVKVTEPDVNPPAPK